MFHGKRGELRQRYREGQEDQLGALGLVVNIIVLWNTLYMTAAVERLRQHGYPVLEEDFGPAIAADLRAHQHARAVFLCGTGRSARRAAALRNQTTTCDPKRYE